MKTMKYDEIYAPDEKALNKIKHPLPWFRGKMYNRRKTPSALNRLNPEGLEITLASKVVN